jgi:hypothetical protein
MMLQANQTELSVKNDPRITHCIKTLSRDTNVLLGSIENNIFEPTITNSMLRRNIDKCVSNGNKPIDIINGVNDLGDLIKSSNFDKNMANDPGFFKYIYNHPMLIYQKEYKAIKDTHRENNIKLIMLNMKDNSAFKPEHLVQENKPTFPVQRYEDVYEDGYDNGYDSGLNEDFSQDYDDDSVVNDNYYDDDYM